MTFIKVYMGKFQKRVYVGILFIKIMGSLYVIFIMTYMYFRYEFRGLLYTLFTWYLFYKK